MPTSAHKFILTGNNSNPAPHKFFHSVFSQKSLSATIHLEYTLRYILASSIYILPDHGLVRCTSVFDIELGPESAAAFPAHSITNVVQEFFQTELSFPYLITCILYGVETHATNLVEFPASWAGDMGPVRRAHFGASAIWRARTTNCSCA